MVAVVGDAPDRDADDGLFGPRSVTWRVHADPVFPVAGVRALLLQALHPLTMAAVEQHPGFDEDFWGRLDRTGQYVTTLTFGTPTRHGGRPRGSAASTADCSGADPETGRPSSGSTGPTCCSGCTAARSTRSCPSPAGRARPSAGRTPTATSPSRCWRPS